MDWIFRLHVVCYPHWSKTNNNPGMHRISLFFFVFPLVAGFSYSQERAVQLFLSDTSMTHASVSLCIKDADNGQTITEYNAGKSLTPASVMKLITSGAALELLGPNYISGHQSDTPVLLTNAPDDYPEI